ncbi:MAG: hypothetical protein HC896_08550 [Bacteroidales bacterium]|nr:hypothetical protein [Bacteroidales bacterium]
MMSYIDFDKSEIINLEYSLSKEILRSNRAGSYSCTTIVGCNTRRYHGLLVSPMEHLDNNKHVLLSGVHETVVLDNNTYNLGIHKYQGDNFTPKGHKYIRDFELSSFPVTTYRIGQFVLQKQLVLVEKSEQVLIKYIVLDAADRVTFMLRPFLAFRNIHQLSKANLHANTKVQFIENGIKQQLYDGYPYLHMQFSDNVEFIQVPDWYHNIEYLEEMRRGYDYKEDLFVPGYFETKLGKGDELIFSASVAEEKPSAFKKNFTDETKKRTPRDSFANCLKNSAEQFFIKQKNRTDLIAGFPWYGSLRRETFVALPGLTLTLGNEDLFKEVMDSMISTFNGCSFEKTEVPGLTLRLASADAMLWMIWAIQQWNKIASNEKTTWKLYGPFIEKVLNCFLHNNINCKVTDYGLVYANTNPHEPISWMDAVVENHSVTHRNGYIVEINALWYNAVKFYLQIAEPNHAKELEKWQQIAGKAEEQFEKVFWLEDLNYLADYVDADTINKSVRPNQVIAVSMDYTPLPIDKRKAVIDICERELLTTRGLRSLSPKNPLYKSNYDGNHEQRLMAAHNGSVWPWLFQHYALAYLHIHKKSGIPHIKRYISEFENDMAENGVGSISELYDGNPPHRGRGAISYAPSVAALLFAIKLVEDYS